LPFHKDHLLDNEAPPSPIPFPAVPNSQPPLPRVPTHPPAVQSQNSGINFSKPPPRPVPSPHAQRPAPQPQESVPFNLDKPLPQPGGPPPINRANQPPVNLDKPLPQPGGPPPIRRDTKPTDSAPEGAVDVEQTQVEASGKRFLLIPIKNLFRYSKSKHPPRVQREEFVSSPLGNDLLPMLQAPPKLAFQFHNATCYELLNGKVYDANYEFFPEDKPPKSPYPYRVDIWVADQPDQARETMIGQIQLHRHDQGNSSPFEIIPLHKELPCLTVRQGLYLFRASGPRFFLVSLPHDVPFEQHQLVDGLLMKFGLLQRMNPKGKVSEDNSVNKAASVINSGGEVIGKGLAKGSGYLGKGMRSASTFYQSKTKRHEPSKEEKTEFDEKAAQNQAAGFETAEKASGVFVKGARGVGTGIRKGFGFVGRTGATIADGSAKQVKKTEWYQEREQKKTSEKEDDGRESNLTGAGNVAKSTVKAGSSVISGFKQGTRTVAKDIRNTTADITEHHKGESAGQQTRQGFNIFGKTAIGGAYCVSLASVGTFHCVAYTGVGALTYDPDKRDVLEGIAWKVGWVTKQGSFMNPWSPRFAILRTYSIAFYKHPKDSVPSSYIHTDEIRTVEKVTPDILDKDYVFSIQTDADLLYFSLALPPELAEQVDLSPEELSIEWNSWVNSISAIGRASQYSKLKKKFLD